MSKPISLSNMAYWAPRSGVDLKNKFVLSITDFKRFQHFLIL